MNSFIQDIIMKSPNKMITYAEYIKNALYHPKHGYYMNDEVKIGRSGDFITTSNVSNVFGKIMAKWYSTHHLKYDLPAAVCEIGGGNGRFAKAFLEGWNQYSTIPLTYILIETSPFHRKLQVEELQSIGNIIQYSELSELRDFSGLVFSNELFDALPVHMIEKKGAELFEVMVTFRDGELSEELVPLVDEKILDFIEDQEIKFYEGQRIEIPLAMKEVLREINHMLTSGVVITVDYGYTNEEWREPERRKGSLRGYYRQRMYDNVLQYPGLMDITSHVHFDALVSEGELQGLKFLSKQRQDEYLLSIGILDELAENFDPNPFSEKSKQNRAIRSLVLPGGMSSAFHVIIQQKGLSGLIK
ncbi:SAM-dependent methyltransferase, MidA family [Mesobacillus persicus]|uniref:SAM-dependent methyltransferase, MidA family n=1 Tax=Mesobacillus persicus TaxID=930146 RepID=A0A1H7X363_9BACI|nr:SAM-dependent methyltransferase [Mesobacillus persicus]SEM28173.1 SAM-dependent methyltransferase, MidA family [Mesobacillus persicus]